MADHPSRQELLTALTTEHFTLQGARAQTERRGDGIEALFPSPGRHPRSGPPD